MWGARRVADEPMICYGLELDWTTHASAYLAVLEAMGVSVRDDTNQQHHAFPRIGWLRRRGLLRAPCGASCCPLLHRHRRCTWQGHRSRGAVASSRRVQVDTLQLRMRCRGAAGQKAGHREPQPEVWREDQENFIWTNSKIAQAERLSVSVEELDRMLGDSEDLQKLKDDSSKKLLHNS